tara:strand:+ start:902 stop:1417 length:516 start_codon:yes stop_codon:yes gene_type:complete
MDHKIIVREKKETDNDQIENILINNFGENRLQRSVYLYRKKSPIKGLSLVSCLNEDPNTIIGTITFYRTLINNINCLLLGPLAVSNHLQGKGFGKILVRKGLELAKLKNETICFVSGEYNYYKEFDFLKLSSKNLIINALGDLTYGELLVKELKKDCINLLPLKAQLLPEK